MLYREIGQSQITLSSDSAYKNLGLQKKMRVFLEVLVKVTDQSCRLCLWFGEEDDGSGVRLEFTDLLFPKQLAKLSSQSFNFYVSDFLESGNKDTYLADRILSAILPRVELDIYFDHSSQSQDALVVELELRGLAYSCKAEPRLVTLDQVLWVEMG